MSKQTKQKEGWYGSSSSRNYHYFVEGRSLCGSYCFPDYTSMAADSGNTEQQQGDCKACFRKLLKRRKDLGVSKIKWQKEEPVQKEKAVLVKKAKREGNFWVCDCGYKEFC